jgi:hypothetical protein
MNGGLLPVSGKVSLTAGRDSWARIVLVHRGVMQFEKPNLRSEGVISSCLSPQNPPRVDIGKLEIMLLDGKGFASTIVFR